MACNSCSQLYKYKPPTCFSRASHLALSSLGPAFSCAKTCQPEPQKLQICSSKGPSSTVLISMTSALMLLLRS